MRMRKVLFLMSLIGFIFSLAVGQADAGKNAEEKLSATLRAQIEVKNDYVKEPTSPKFKALKEMGLQEAKTQVVFLHSKKPLTKRQIESLRLFGVAVFKDSWIPPFGGHATGFTATKIPVGKIGGVAKKRFVVRLETAEQNMSPQNDLAAEAVNAGPVWNLGHDGKGVKIAILDSGLDTTHPDIPKPIASKDYSNYPNLDDTIENLVTGHGTHVAGSLLGRGVLSGGKYKGIAHGATDFIFLKIGNDRDSMASSPAMVAAIRDAVDIYGADILSISYGGRSQYKDGTDEICQVVDDANSKGALVFVAAGNEGNRQNHFAATVAGESESDYIQLDVMSLSDGNYIILDMNWLDGIGVSNNLRMKLYDADKKEIRASTFRDVESPRGTELEVLSVFVPLGTYYLKVENKSPNEQFFHLYSLNPWVTFANADPNYTVLTPALADGAVAVASYATRLDWINYLGDYYSYPGQIGEISSFSSRGPRIDGAEKPQLAAPGEWVISARDKILTLGGADYLIIDNDGINDGKGPADYMVSVGTSMSCPVAAGGAALLISANLSLKGNPDALLKLLEDTASEGGVWNNVWGYGLIDLSAALQAIPPVPTPTPQETPSPTIPPVPTPTETSIPTPIPTPTSTQSPEPTPEPTPKPEIINDLVTFEPIKSTYQTTSDTTGCPEGFVGKFSFDARLTNKNSSSPISNLIIKVKTLTNGNLLHNADGGHGGVGSTLTVLKKDDYSDAILSPGEFVDVNFIICLKEKKSFKFVVDVLGVEEARGINSSQVAELQSTSTESRGRNFKRGFFSRFRP